MPDEKVCLEHGDYCPGDCLKPKVPRRLREGDHDHVFNMEAYGILVCEHCGRDAVVCPTCHLCSLCVFDKRAVETIYDTKGRV